MVWIKAAANFGSEKEVRQTSPGLTIQSLAKRAMAVSSANRAPLGLVPHRTTVAASLGDNIFVAGHWRLLPGPGVCIAVEGVEVAGVRVIDLVDKWFHEIKTSSDFKPMG